MADARQPTGRRENQKILHFCLLPPQDLSTFVRDAGTYPHP